MVTLSPEMSQKSQTQHFNQVWTLVLMVKGGITQQSWDRGAQ